MPDPAWPGAEKAWTFLAPMEGVTHPAFRALIARRPGVGVVCTEFVRIAATGIGERHLARQVVRADGAALSVQVMGNHLEHMAEATAIVAAAGADIVDLNVGCPAPRVVRKGVGSAMLKDPELLRSVVSRMRERTRGCLSAKIRAGFDDSSGAVATARVIESAGADFIVVHPRRRVDFYQGVADWRIIRAIKRSVRIPVIGNGDVWYAADALRMRQETGCDGVMIGRGALRNPWIFEQIDALLGGRVGPRPNGDDVLAHYDALAETLRVAYPKNTLGMLKEQVRYLARVVREGAAFMSAALRATTAIELRAVLGARLAGEGAEAIDLAAQGGTLETSGSALGS
ncbi:MAG TPA: tRNA-dihydrouridine synthase family protein [Polyangiaceae bacterium]|nr:tRNA-dihydrouridine synthase family protein [Polyangiaceae bacterium]